MLLPGIISWFYGSKHYNWIMFNAWLSYDLVDNKIIFVVIPRFRIITTNLKNIKPWISYICSKGRLALICISSREQLIARLLLQRRRTHTISPLLIRHEKIQFETGLHKIGTYWQCLIDKTSIFLDTSTFTEYCTRSGKCNSCRKISPKEIIGNLLFSFTSIVSAIKLSYRNISKTILSFCHSEPSCMINRKWLFGRRWRSCRRWLLKSVVEQTHSRSLSLGSSSSLSLGPAGKYPRKWCLWVGGATSWVTEPSSTVSKMTLPSRGVEVNLGPDLG